jgi:GNAT superfamily N-acetyltransferase
MVEVRIARVEDADAMADVNAAGWREGYADIVPAEYRSHLPVGRWRREMTAGLESPRGDSFTRIGDMDGAFAGYCFVAAPGREEPDDSKLAELVALYVYPVSWGRGVGRALLDAVVGEAGRLGYEEMLLWTFRANRRAQGLYERAGFLRDGVERPFVPLGIPTVRMRRSLAPVRHNAGP